MGGLTQFGGTAGPQARAALMLLLPQAGHVRRTISVIVSSSCRQCHRSGRCLLFRRLRLHRSCRTPRTGCGRCAALQIFPHRLRHLGFIEAFQQFLHLRLHAGVFLRENSRAASCSLSNVIVTFSFFMFVILLPFYPIRIVCSCAAGAQISNSAYERILPPGPPPAPRPMRRALPPAGHPWSPALSVVHGLCAWLAGCYSKSGLPRSLLPG